MPPAAASNPVPPDSSVDQSTSILLQWASADQGGDVRYDLFFGTEATPPLYKHALKTTHHQLSDLSRSTTYHWRVVSVDPEGGDTPGPLWTFSTGIGHAPDAPSNPSPPDRTTAMVTDHITLTWNGNDADQDTLSYDVYAGDSNPPPLLAESIHTNAINMEVSVFGQYAWRVVAHDAYGFSASSPVWYFNTSPVSGRIYHVAGTGTAGFGPVGMKPLETNLYWPMDVIASSRETVTIADWNNHRIIRADLFGSGLMQLVAGDDGDLGDPCPMAPAPCTDITAAGAPLNMPTQVVTDNRGNFVICAWRNDAIFQVGALTGKMDRICGTGAPPAYNGDEQLAVNASVGRPVGAAFDSQNRLCFTDQWNQIVRMIDGSGVIHTIAGTAPTWNGVGYDRHQGFSGDDGPAISATLNLGGGQVDDPAGKICFDPTGNMYIADTLNHAIRVVDTSGMIHRFAGVYPASAGFGGEGGLATAAHLSSPSDVASDHEGNIYIADTGNHCVRVVSLIGVITTVAGIPTMSGDGGNGGVATATMLNSPFGISIDEPGFLWIADTRNNRIRVMRGAAMSH